MQVPTHFGSGWSQTLRPSLYYRRMGPLSRPFVRSGQWSQTTAGMFQPAARLSKTAQAVRSGPAKNRCDLSHIPGGLETCRYESQRRLPKTPSLPSSQMKS